MDRVFLSLGSNLGDRIEFLQKAVEVISCRIGTIVQTSSIYQTEPWGYTDPNLYLNQVIQVNTVLKPKPILDTIKEIEKSMGRIRGKERYSARTIDIDILFYGVIISSSPQLVLPHPQIANRRFILIPLAEIAEDLIHPVHKKSIKKLLEECTDRGEVYVFQN